jgi:hypothetical protein
MSVVYLFCCSANLTVRLQGRSDKGHNLSGFINFKKITWIAVINFSNIIMN